MEKPKMNQRQWIVLSFGLFILGFILLSLRGPACLMPDGDLLIACYIRRYSFAIPGIIFMALGIILSIMNFLNLKK